MQTFLICKDFQASAAVLDRQRLGKQRVEILQILNVLTIKSDGGWRNHPAVRMWRGYELALADYGFAICNEWKSRGYKDTCREKIGFIESYLMEGDIKYRKLPPWLGDEKFHASHRSNLLRKKPEYYKQFNWAEPDNLPYVWPV